MIRRASEAEWQKVKELRLHALDDTPEAFGRSATEEALYPDDLWRTRLRNTDSATFVYVDDDEFNAMVTVIIEREQRMAELFGMFVAPSLRLRGIGRALLAAAEKWAQSEGAQVLRLEVNQTLEPALTLYSRAGYRMSGLQRVFHSDGAVAIEMTKRPAK